jgi:nitroreductase
MQTQATDVHAALTGRKSVRAYLDTAVPRSLLERILTVAARAPSGNNTQPWQVNVVTGDARARLSAALLQQRAHQTEPPRAEYDYFPEVWPEPHLTRRRDVGWALYNIIGVQRGDREGAAAHHDRNFEFFGAPVGLILSIDRRLGVGGYLDIGLFMQALATAAVAEGLATCLQAAFAPYHATLRQQLDIDPQQKIICGMSLGFEDTTAPINALHTPRAPLSEFARFHTA